MDSRSRTAGSSSCPWVLSSYLVNILFENNLYRKPFFITYINTACFSFYLIPQLDTVRSEFGKGGADRRNSASSISPLVADTSSSFNNNNNNYNDTQSHVYTKSTSDVKEVGIVYNTSEIDTSKSTNDIENRGKLSFGETISLSAQFCILWFLSILQQMPRYRTPQSHLKQYSLQLRPFSHSS